MLAGWVRRGALVLCLAAPVWAARAPRAKVNGKEEAGIVARFAVLSPGITKLQIAHLRHSGWQWSEISRILIAARLAAKPVWTIAELRNSGMAWDEIAKKCGIDPKQLTTWAKFIEGSAVPQKPRKGLK